LVNESSDKLIPGDVSIFASQEELGTYLEPWYVDEDYFACDIVGRLVRLEVVDGRVAARLASFDAEEKLPRIYLEAKAASIVEAGKIAFNYLVMSDEQLAAKLVQHS
jgi:hypothetical protein